MIGRRVISAATGALACTMIAAGWWAAVDSSDAFDTAQIAAFLTVVVLGSQLAGLTIAFRDRAAWTGQLVQVSSLAVFTGAASHGDLGAIVPSAAIIASATAAVPALLVLNRAGPVPPHNRTAVVQRRASQVSVAIAAALAVPLLLVTDRMRSASAQWWRVEGGVTPSDAARLVMVLHSIAVITAVTCSTAALLGRVRRAVPAERSRLRPVTVSAVAWALVTVLDCSVVAWESPVWIDRTGGFTPWAMLALVALPMLTGTAFVGAVIWSELAVPRLRRTDAGMVLRRDPDASVTTYVQHALADPSARALFPGPTAGQWIDELGDPASLGDDVDRALTVFRRDDHVVGAIAHDAQLAAHPEAVELVATAAGLALERASLAADAAASVRAARTLTARLVLAPDMAREELSRALASGPDAELRAIGEAIRSGASLDAVSERLRAVAAQVRVISHGLLPPSLAEGGLHDALSEATVSTRQRFATAVEVTAYLAARDDSAATIDLDRGSLRIQLSKALTDATLLDRVAVLGGTVDRSSVSATQIILPVEA